MLKPVLHLSVLFFLLLSVSDAVSPFAFLVHSGSCDPGALVLSVSFLHGQCLPWGTGNVFSQVTCSHGIATIATYSDPSCITSPVDRKEYDTTVEAKDVSSFRFNNVMVGCVRVTCDPEDEVFENINLPTQLELILGGCTGGATSGIYVGSVWITNQTGAFPIVHNVMISPPNATGAYTWKTGSNQVASASLSQNALVPLQCAFHPSTPNMVMMRMPSSPLLSFSNKIASYKPVCFEVGAVGPVPADADLPGLITMLVLIVCCLICSVVCHFFVPSSYSFDDFLRPKTA